MFDGVTEETERQFGSWLRAIGRRLPAGGGNPWLISDKSSTKMVHCIRDQEVGRTEAVYSGNVRGVGGQCGTEVKGSKDKFNVSQQGTNVLGLSKYSSEGSGDGPVEVDQKRRRVDRMEGVEMNITEMSLANLALGSKNGFMAGSGFQAHQSQ